MKGKFTNNEYHTVDSGEAAYLIFKGFNYKLDVSDPQTVMIIFPAQNEDALTLIKELKNDWWVNNKHKEYLQAYQNLIRAIKSVQHSN